MPSGYTSDLYEGKPVTFPEFAMTCARAFGALIDLRDEPLDAPIPDEISQSDYYGERLSEAKQRLIQLRAMSADEVAQAAACANAAALDQWERSQAKSLARRQRYEAMLAEVEAWAPPTEEHQGLKDFMIQQITESARLDCSVRDRPVEVDPATWFVSAVDEVKRQIDYCTEQAQQEAERAAGRTAWVRALRASLEPSA
jgi:hypothetical protein